MILGCAARGDSNDPPLDHSTGEGRVDHHPGHYSSALAAKRLVHIMHSEITGAMPPTTLATYRRLAKLAAAKKGTDRTVYGIARGATTSFYAHHTRLASLAIASSVADAILRHAKETKEDVADIDLHRASRAAT